MQMAMDKKAKKKPVKKPAKKKPAKKKDVALGLPKNNSRKRRDSDPFKRA